MHTYYTIHCFNEWCSGPSKYKVVDKKPLKYHCPICGWLALPNDGIKKHTIPDKYVTKKLQKV